MSLMCCVAMCLTTFVLASDAVPPSAIPGKVFLGLYDGVTFVDEEGYEMTSPEVLGGSNYTCNYNAENQTIEFVYDYESAGTTRQNWAVNDVISFYAKVADDEILKVTPSSAAGSVTVTEFVDEYNIYNGANRKIEVKLGKSVTSRGLVLTPSVESPKYNVTFPLSGNDYTITVSDQDVTGETLQYAKGENVVFKVAATAAGKAIEVWNGRVEVPCDKEGQYTLAVTGDVSLSIKLVDEKYTITGASGDGYTYVPNGSNEVVHGGTFSFYVNPKAGYGAIKDVTAAYEDGTEVEVLNVGGTQYVINNITGHVTISVEASSEKEQYSVIYSTGTGYQISEDATASVEYGTDATFTVKVDTGYNVTSVTYTMGGKRTILSLNENNSYTIPNVTGDVDVTVTAVRATYQVTVDDTQVGNTATVNTPAGTTFEHGSQYTFYVTPEPGFEAPVVKVNGVELAPVGNNQYVTTITELTSIVIAKGTAIQYNVTLIGGGEDDGFTYISKSATVGHNDTYAIEVKVDDAYANSKVVISVNGTPVAATRTGNTYTYTIENITEHKTVSVSGLVKNTYKVTFVNGNGYTFATTDNTSVTAGDDFRFTLSVLPGFDGANVQVKANDEVVTKDANGVYTVEVNGDTAITLTGVKEVTYKATLTENSGNAKIDSNITDIVYNGSYVFTVVPTVGYRVTQVAVNGTEITAVNGVYTVNGVTKDLEIYVATVENKLTVNYVSNEKNHEHTEAVVYDYTKLLESNPLTLAPCTIHAFAGWYNGEIRIDSIAAFQDLIAKDDASVTLTAAFELKEEIKVLDLGPTTKELSTLGEGYRATFRTLVSNLSTDPCVAEYVKVTGYGTLLANKDEVVFTEIDLSSRVEGDGYHSAVPANDATGNDRVFNYYVNCNYTWDEFKAALNEESAKSSIILRIQTKNEKNTFNAAGWIELSIGEGENETKVYVRADASGTALTQGLVADDAQ